MRVYPCPACGFQVFEEPPGSYDICPICGWEDDDVQLKFPGKPGGANKESLFIHQARFLRGVPSNVKERNGYRRDRTWRPLKPEECVTDEQAPRSRPKDFRSSTGGPYEDYYWRKR
jgi:hypothetical protein